MAFTGAQITRGSFESFPRWFEVLTCPTVYQPCHPLSGRRMKNNKNNWKCCYSRIQTQRTISWKSLCRLLFSMIPNQSVSEASTLTPERRWCQDKADGNTKVRISSSAAVPWTTRRAPGPVWVAPWPMGPSRPPRWTLLEISDLEQRRQKQNAKERQSWRTTLHHSNFNTVMALTEMLWSFPILKHKSAFLWWQIPISKKAGVCDSITI